MSFPHVGIEHCSMTPHPSHAHPWEDQTHLVASDLHAHRPSHVSGVEVIDSTSTRKRVRHRRHRIDQRLKSSISSSQDRSSNIGSVFKSQFAPEHRQKEPSRTHTARVATLSIDVFFASPCSARPATATSCARVTGRTRSCAPTFTSAWSPPVSIGNSARCPRRPHVASTKSLDTSMRVDGAKIMRLIRRGSYRARIPPRPCQTLPRSSSSHRYLLRDNRRPVPARRHVSRHISAPSQGRHRKSSLTVIHYRRVDKAPCSRLSIYNDHARLAHSQTAP